MLYKFVNFGNVINTGDINNAIKLCSLHLMQLNH